MGGVSLLRLGPLGMREIFRCFTTHERKTCALSCQICGHFFVNMYVKLALIGSIFQLKMHQITFGSWAPPRSARSLHTRPSWIKESLLLRRGMGSGGEGERRGGKGTGVEVPSFYGSCWCCCLCVCSRDGPACHDRLSNYPQGRTATHG